MIPYRTPTPNHLHAPHVQAQTIQQPSTSCDHEPKGRVQGDGVSEIQQRAGDAAQEDGELEPGEEGALGGKVDFRFDADGDVDAWLGWSVRLLTATHRALV